MSEQVITQQQLQLYPEYQENFAKDLYSNIYRTEERQAIDPVTGELMFEIDPETGEQVPVMESYAAGIAALSPLTGEPQFEQKIDPVTGEPMVDARGDPIYDETKPIYERDAEGNLKLDVYGQPIQKVIGGIPAPTVAPLTEAQQKAIDLGISGIGAYAPMMEQAKGTYASGISALETGYDPLTGEAKAYDPKTGYKDYYDPYVEDVITATQDEIQRRGDLQKQGERARAVQSGAFGGSRQVVAEQEIQRNLEALKAKTGAELRSKAFTEAQDFGATAFENQMNRGATGAQIFSQLGTAEAGLGQLAQTLGNTDVKSLLNVGGVEQTQQQAEIDAYREGAIETAMEPYQRFGYMSDILQGTPTTASTMTAKSAPEQNVIGDTVGTYLGLDSYGSGGGQILPGLGS